MPHLEFLIVKMVWCHIRLYGIEEHSFSELCLYWRIA